MVSPHVDFGGIEPELDQVADTLKSLTSNHVFWCNATCHHFLECDSTAHSTLLDGRVFGLCGHVLEVFWAYLLVNLSLAGFYDV